MEECVRARGCVPCVGLTSSDAVKMILACFLFVLGSVSSCQDLCVKLMRQHVRTPLYELNNMNIHM